MRRVGNIRAITDHPLARKHLQVCWANRSPTGHCSRCQKCVRTMLCLDVCGRLADCDSFAPSRPLDRKPDVIPSVLPCQI